MTLVHEHMLRAAARTPDAPAIHGDVTLSYRELERASGGLAAALRELGLEEGGRVAIGLPKSERFATAIFATLRAGGAYVPLDASQPPARIATIVADAEPTVLITEPALLGRLVELGLPASVRGIVLDGGGADVSLAGITAVPFAACTARGDAADVPRTPHDLAIILYTSGSTGVPKGVQISHENLRTFIDWATGEMALRPDDVFANHAGFHFDLSTFDLFAAMAAGASVWIICEDEARDAAALAREIHERRISVWYSVPSTLVMMLGAGAFTGAVAERLRYVLFAGEVFPIKHLRDLQARIPGTTLYNLYGPTETNVCTFHRLDTIPPDRAQPVPIGLPIDDTAAWIVDEDGVRYFGTQIEGVVGELVIAGPCVTPGYWRRTGYENEANHRQRIHATGDLVTVEDGAYVYRGRKDRMVKLNGFRVELGEIEAALLRHPTIAEAAVVAAVEEGATRLIAYYTGNDQASASPLQLRAHLAGLVPRYMIPHRFARLDALPRNRNGKIDLPRLSEHAAS